MCGWWWGRRCGAPVGLQPGQVPHTFYGGTALADAELEAGFGSVPALVHQELQEVIQNPADGDVQALPVPGAQVNKAQLGEGQAAEVFRADLVCVGVEATVVQIAGQGVGVGVADADRSQRALLGERTPPSPIRCASTVATPVSVAVMLWVIVSPLLGVPCL